MTTVLFWNLNKLISIKVTIYLDSINKEYCTILNNILTSIYIFSIFKGIFTIVKESSNQKSTNINRKHSEASDIISAID